jgi:Tfp pilus assembly protein PilN
MDEQEQALLTIEQQEIADLKNRVAALEQAVQHMRDVLDHLADHSGFSHPGWGA